MESDFPIDIEEMRALLQSAEVVSLFFPLLRKTLIIDARHNEAEGPMVRLVSMVDSIEERFRTLRRLRPRFPRPESITIIPWPKGVDSLERLGLWDVLVQKMMGTGHHHMANVCLKVAERLRQLERQESLAAVAGTNYDSLWERHTSTWQH